MNPLLADVTVPVQFGLPQIILSIVGLCGLALLLYVLFHAVRGKHDPVKGIRVRRFFWRRGISGALLMVISISLIYLALLLQTYLGLTGEILAAKVQARQLGNIQHYMQLDLSLYDQNGNKLSEDLYGVCGDEWMLQADIVRFPGWVNILGIHSGYKLTRLEGRYDDANMESTWFKTVVTLNGGDDTFFSSTHNAGWLSFLVKSQYGSGAFQSPNGAYEVFVSQDALTINGDSTTVGTFNGTIKGSSPTDCRQLHL